MQDYHQAEQDLLFGVLDALPCAAALLSREGQPAYVNPKGDACGLSSFDTGALPLVREALRGKTPPAGWVTLRARSDAAFGAASDSLSGLAEAYPVRVDERLMGALFMLRPDVTYTEDFDALPYVSEAMEELRTRLTRLSAIGVPALFLGEEGVGRAAFARALHDMSRPGEPFCEVSCRVEDEDALDRELFGDIPHPGALRALSGTVFLTGVDALSPHLQRCLLALLQNKMFSDGMPFLARLSASGPPRLETMVQTGQFDAGLYARLSVMPVQIAPLRERSEDILPLARYFLRRYSALFGDPVTEFSPDACRTLQNYAWPGNIKELEDVVLEALLHGAGGEIKSQHLPIPADGVKADLHRQRQGFTRKRIEEALALHGRTVEGKRRAAKELGIGLSTLYRLIGDKK